MPAPIQIGRWRLTHILPLRFQPILRLLLPLISVRVTATVFVTSPLNQPTTLALKTLPYINRSLHF